MIKKIKKSNAIFFTYSIVVWTCLVGPDSLAAEQKSEKVVKQKKPVKAEHLKHKKAAPKEISLDEQLSFAKADLSQRLDVKESALTVLKSESVTWRSGAIGCPQAGDNYTYALTPGLLIVIAADSKHYRYHASRFTTPFLCDALRAESPISDSGDI